MTRYIEQELPRCKLKDGQVQEQEMTRYIELELPRYRELKGQVPEQEMTRNMSRSWSGTESKKDRYMSRR